MALLDLNLVEYQDFSIFLASHDHFMHENFIKTKFFDFISESFSSQVGECFAPSLLSVEAECSRFLVPFTKMMRNTLLWVRASKFPTKITFASDFHFEHVVLNHFKWWFWKWYPNLQSFSFSFSFFGQFLTHLQYLRQCSRKIFKVFANPSKSNRYSESLWLI